MLSWHMKLFSAKNLISVASSFTCLKKFFYFRKLCRNLGALQDGQELEHADQLLHVEPEHCRLGVQHSGGASHRPDSLLPPDVPVETHQFQHTMQGKKCFLGNF